MKTIIWFVSVCMVFSSCYNYKHLDLHSDHLASGDYYALTTASDHTWKGRVVEITDSIVTLKTSSDQLINFPIAQLSRVQRRKLAVGKTIGLSVSVGGIALGLTVMSMYRSRTGTNYNIFFPEDWHQ
ncbi:MAG: hypothetical protein MUO53_12095 [Maribacter sp.]|nr:hypothetical protein [Maribacter sp.]